jgi:ankyrin repeat protein
MEDEKVDHGSLEEEEEEEDYDEEDLEQEEDDEEEDALDEHEEEEDDEEVDPEELHNLWRDANSLAENLGAMQPGFLSKLMKPMPLHEAARAGDLERVKQIVEQEQREVDERDGFSYTALHIAAEEGHVPVIEYLVAKGANLEAESGLKKCRPLHYAVLGGKANSLVKLIELGAELEGRNEDGRTALWQAVLAEKPELVRTLIEKGASALATDISGKLAIDILSESDEAEQIRSVLLKRKNEQEQSRSKKSTSN